MNRTIEDIQKDIELLGIKGGYDIEQLLTPQDCRRLSYEIERLNNIINELEKVLDENVELTYVHYGKRQYNKTLTEGGLLFRDYIKSKLQELKGSDK